jgi:FkbM family methyltransferase
MSTNYDLPILDEADFARVHLAPHPAAAPRMIQIGANEGKFEYAKEDGKDFVFEFLAAHPNWEAVMIEPIPDVFESLKANYSAHSNKIQFLNCAIAETVERRSFVLQGKDGKSSHLINAKAAAAENRETIEVQCIDYALMRRLVNWTQVDFIKIDAEGYDERIVADILESSPPEGLPTYLMWEQIGLERMQTTERLIEMGYEVSHTGLAKNGSYLDRLAILPTRRASK